jgi:hypothetical protein
MVTGDDWVAAAAITTGFWVKQLRSLPRLSDRRH